MVRTRLAALVVVGMATVVGGGASLAWACSPSPWIEATPGQGVGGSRVVVNGGEWKSAVEIRWNSMSGPVLASATTTSFSVEVTIPQASPGVYTLVAAGQGDVLAGKASASFEVTVAGSGIQSSGSSGGGPGGATTSADGSSSRGGGSAAGRQPGGVSIPGEPTTAGDSAGAAEMGAAPAQSAGTPAAPTSAQNRAAVAERAPSSPTGSSSASAAGREAASVDGSQAVVAGTAESARPVVPSGSTSGDLWSGFTTGNSVSLATGGIESGTTGSTLSGPGVALVGLGLGTTALLAGAAVASRRRRVVA